ncbi:AAA family ATPase, partial [Oscillatoriales cyanobacterium LEGE 11467]
MSLIFNFLIGIPGSGKSTFAQQWIEADSSYAIVSTDSIREQLFGDESVQGDWKAIEAEVFAQICTHIANGTSIIYDATNAKRPWRLGFLQPIQQQLETHPKIDDRIEWMAWHLDTDIAICKQRNQQRQRIVPDAILDDMATALERFPPMAAEGFVDVNAVPLDSEGNYDLAKVLRKIESLPRRRISRANRSRQVEWHPYSLLLDFDRLMFLIALILHHPGLGNRDRQDMDKEMEFETSAEEVSVAMAREHGAVYADIDAIARDLAWLEANGFIHPKTPTKTPTKTLTKTLTSVGRSHHTAITLETCKRPANTETHRYSDRLLFLRLMGIIRAILRSPLQEIPGENSLDTLVQQLAESGIVGETRDNLRRDIEKALKPYGIFNAASYRRGYFIGTAILTPSELNAAYKLLQSQAQRFDDPVALEAYQIFGDRLKQSKLLAADERYPVRVLGTKSIFNPADLPSSALIRHTEILERGIETGELLELKRLQGGGRFVGDVEEFFCVWPLQLVFHNIAWYLGFECCGGDKDGLLRFGRLDRLFLGQPTHQTRSMQQQKTALKRLTQLYDASAGAFLGNSAAEQKLYLSGNGRQQMEIVVELWCSDGSFRFISEGTQRFAQMQMSPKRSGSSRNRSIFSLQGTGDSQFPHRVRVRLPRWSVGDVDLKRWIVGWGGEVK